MRDYRYRAFDKDKNHMVYEFDGKPILDGTREYRLVWAEGRLQLSHFEGYLYDPKHYVLMQSTDLKDKNGVEIYEGDILKMNYMGVKAAVVKWLAGHFVACGILGAGDYDGSDCEVIGNIHEIDLTKHDNLDIIESYGIQNDKSTQTGNKQGSTGTSRKRRNQTENRDSESEKDKA